MPKILLRKFVLHTSAACLLLLLGSTAGRAQNPACRPSQPLPKNPPRGVVGLSLSRDGKTLVSAGADGHIRFWDMQTGRVRRTLSGHTNAIYVAVFSPDDKLVASSSRDTTVRIWDAATGREIHKLTGYRCSVKSVAFSPNGRMVASAGNDGLLKLWDVRDGKELKSLTHTNAPGVDASMYSVAFSRDGRKIYVGNGDGRISEWETATGRETKVWKAHNETVMTLAFTRDHRVLASGGYGDLTVKLWDAATKREIRTLAEKKTGGLLEQLKPVAFSPDGKLLATGTVGFDSKLRQYVYHRTNVWSVATGEKLFTLEGHKFDVDALVFTPDNRYVLSGSVDGTIKFWDVATGREARTLTVPPVGQAND